MFTKSGFHTFIYGERVKDAEAPPFLKFRSSNALIIATIAIAVFTVRICLDIPNKFLSLAGYFSLLFGCSCLAFCFDDSGRS